MSEQTTERSKYKVRVSETADAPGTLTFTFVPTTRGQRSTIVVHGSGEAARTEWVARPTSEESAQEIERDALERVSARHEWIERVNLLVAAAEAWARELGWETRRVGKKLDDSHVGSHTVPALLMQHETLKALLDPVARAAPGVEGVVDLYRLPAYDDVAGLSFREGGWHLHGTPPGPAEAPARPFTKEAFGEVLAGMKANARSL
jgi:hypothetical protein